jgi:hypothetical protein
MMLHKRSCWDDEEDERKVRRKAQPKATDLLRSPFFFQRFLEDVRKAGLVGEKKNALALYIVATSRFRPRPVNALVKGSSSVGKNFTVRTVTDNFLPEKTVHGVSSMTERSLNFLDKDDIENSILYFYEVDGSARAAHPNRLLISEGKLVHWYVASTKWGGKEVREEITGGPVACISTTTENALKIDDESRHLSLWLDESPKQTKRIARAYAVENKETLTAEMKTVWIEVQQLIKERKALPIELPGWFEGLVDLIPIGDVRIRRYWPAFVEACKTVCLIRSFRSTKEELERRGGLTVSFKDFAIADLIFDKVVAESLNRNATDEEVWTGELVERIAEQRGRSLGAGVEATNLLGEPGVTSLDKAYRLLRRAERAGTVFRSNLPGKNNGKFYLPSAQLGFIGSPEVVFKRLEMKGGVKFVHPITGEWVNYGEVK